MASRKLTAVVIGAGWAGKGHTKALQHCGVDVLAICARKDDVVQKVAAGLGVPNASTDWRQSLVELKPDIVSLATPAALRTEVVEQAVELECHVLCDKPLATTGEEANRMYILVHEAGVKHAYAATHRYDPSVLWLAELISNQTIGTLQEIEVGFSGPFSNPRRPWAWVNALALGGGILNNAFTHLLGMLERIADGKLTATAGQARVIRKKAPFVPDIHDFRQRMIRQITPEEVEKLEWRACDADDAFSALLQLESLGKSKPITAYVRMNFCAPEPGPTNGWYFYGDEGTLVGQGFLSISVSRQRVPEPEPLPAPQRLADTLPQVGDDVQNKWTALAGDFVADIRGEDHKAYLTFQDGWRYQVAIDAIREGKGWYWTPDGAL